jgi:alkylation response protein AidB-like acyl-CoA dehydrogenase
MFLIMVTDSRQLGLSETQRELQQVVRDFADREARPASVEFEERAEDPAYFYEKIGKMGLTGIPFDPKYGGGGEPYLTYLLVIEELSRAWVGLAIGLSIHTLTCFAIEKYGSDEMRERLLPPMLAGERFGAYALSESSSGSDAASLTTKAERTKSSYKLTGQKQFISRGGEADHILLMARTGEPGPRGITAFIVDKGTDGFRPSKSESKMGWRSSPTWELVFEDCEVPKENLVGEEGDGFKIALSALDSGRLGIAACSIGVAQAALDSALQFAREREQFGRRIADFEGIQFMLADMATQIEAGRALYRRAAQLKDAGLPYSKEASMAKLFCSDSAMRVTTDAVQIHGGYGYIEEYPVERFMRDAKALQIVEGTNQIQRMIIGRHLTQ